MIGTPFDDEALRPYEPLGRLDAAQRDRARLALLDEVGALFAKGGDYVATLATFARLVAPVFGGWCSIELGASEGELEPLAWFGASSAGTRVMVPLMVRGRAIGRLVSGAHRGDREDDKLLLELARRAAMYIDNALLAREVETLEKANVELDQLAYVTSHDLRAPLRGIANLATWIDEDHGSRLDERGREHLALLRGRVRRLEDLISGVLEYGRANRPEDAAVEVDVGHLVHEVIELLAPPPHVRFEIAPDLPMLRTSRVPLQRVLMNLIENAVKYDATAEPVIEIGARTDGNGCELYVRDNGPGIAARDQARIWELFRTLAPRDQRESTGLGLAIVRRIVEAHGGRAWVESREGEGATFRFTWPRSPRRERSWR